MKKSAIVLGAALAFDLGVIVVGSQAAETPKTPPPAPEPAKAAVDYFLKIDGVDGAKARTIYIKLDKVNTAEACSLKMGKVVDTPNGKACEYIPKANGQK